MTEARLELDEIGRIVAAERIERPHGNRGAQSLAEWLAERWPRRRRRPKGVTHGVTTVAIPCDSAQVPTVAIRSRPRARGATCNRCRLGPSGLPACMLSLESTTPRPRFDDG